MTRMPTSWRRRSSRASSSRVVSSGSGRGSGRTPRPKATRTVASIAVGLGQPAGGLGEVAGLAGVDHGHGQAGGGQGRRGQRLQAAGGLEDDQGHLVGLEEVEEPVDPLAAVGDAEGLGVADGDVEGGLGDIDADVLRAV